MLYPYRSLKSISIICCLSTLAPYIATAHTPPSDPIEKDFDKIRKFASYDPATDEWSAIEDFQDVEILTDPTQHREDRYVYYSFWAYDMGLQCWRKVDIRSYGYAWTSGEEAPGSTIDTVSEAKVHHPRNWWRRIGISCSLGAGTTHYKNDIIALQLLERDGKYFLQTRASQRQDRAYLIQWFQKNYEEKQRFSVTHAAYDARTNRKVPFGKKVFFRGIGLKSPLTLAVHYAFFERLRLGIGGSLTLHYLRELVLQGDVSDKRTYTLPDPWIAHIKWFGLIDLTIVKKPDYTVHVTATTGSIYDVGSDWETSWKTRRYLYTHRCSTAGLAYERRLNGYCTLITALSGEYKQYVDKRIFAPDGQIKISQLAMHVSVGLTANLGKNTHTAS